MRHRLVSLVSLLVCWLIAASARGQTNNQSIHVQNNNGTIIINDGRKSASYPGLPADLDTDLVRKIAQALAAQQPDWHAEIGKVLAALAAQRRETREQLQRTARRDVQLDNQIRDVRARLAALSDRESRATNAQLAALEGRLDQQTRDWNELAVKLPASVATQAQIEQLATNLERSSAEIGEACAIATRAVLIELFGPNPALRAAVTLYSGTFAFPSITSSLGASYAWAISERVRLGPALGVAYCCLASPSESGGFAAPSGESLETSTYRPTRLSFEAGPEARLRMRTWNGTRLLAQLLYSHHFVRWDPEAGGARAAYSTPAVALVGAFDMRVFGPLILGLSARAEYDFRSSQPLWRYTGYQGTTVGPARAGGAVLFEGGLHVGVTFLD